MALPSAVKELLADVAVLIFLLGTILFVMFGVLPFIIGKMERELPANVYSVSDDTVCVSYSFEGKKYDASILAKTGLRDGCQATVVINVLYPDDPVLSRGHGPYTLPTILVTGCLFIGCGTILGVMHDKHFAGKELTWERVMRVLKGCGEEKSSLPRDSSDGSSCR